VKSVVFDTVVCIQTQTTGILYNLYASSAACAKHFGKTTGKQSKLQGFKNHFLDIRIGDRQRVIAMWVKCFQNSCRTVFFLCPQSIFCPFKTNDALNPHSYLVWTVTTTKWFIAIVCKQTAGQPDILTSPRPAMCS